jgi:hypothetical protein
MHGGSVWSTRDPLYHARGELALFEFVKQHLGVEYLPAIESEIVRRQCKTAELLLQRSDPLAAAPHATAALRRWRPGRRPPLGYLARLAARTWAAAARARLFGRG